MSTIGTFIFAAVCAALIVYVQRYKAWRRRVTSGSASAWEIARVGGFMGSPMVWLGQLKGTEDSSDDFITKLKVRFFPWTFLVKETMEPWMVAQSAVLEDMGEFDDDEEAEQIDKCIHVIRRSTYTRSESDESVDLKGAVGAILEFIVEHPKFTLSRSVGLVTLETRLADNGVADLRILGVEAKVEEVIADQALSKYIDPERFIRYRVDIETDGSVAHVGYYNRDHLLPILGNVLFLVSNKTKLLSCRFSKSSMSVEHLSLERGKTSTYKIFTVQEDNGLLEKHFAERVSHVLLDTAHSEIPEDKVHHYRRLISQGTSLYAGDMTSYDKAVEDLKKFTEVVEKPDTWQLIRGSAPSLLIIGQDKNEPGSSITHQFSGSMKHLSGLQDIMKAAYAK